MIILNKRGRKYFFNCCIVILFSHCNSPIIHNNDIEEMQVEKQESNSYKKIQGFSLENFQIDSSKVKKGESFSEILQDLNIFMRKFTKLEKNLRVYMT